MDNEIPKPASPLPWRAVHSDTDETMDTDVYSRGDLLWEDFGEAPEQERKDKEYAVWAANNAPKLAARIEQLEAALREIVEGGDSASTDDNGDVWVVNDETVEIIGGYARREPIGVNVSAIARKALE